MTWRTSKPFGAAPTFVSKKTRNAYCVEPEVVELYEPKGRLMVNCRNEAHLPQCPNPGADPKTVAGGGCRVFFFSDDVSAAGPLCRLSLLKEAAQAGETWVNMTARPDLPDPGCKSGTTRYDPAQALLISNIPYGRRFNATNRHDVHAPNPRVNLTIHASTNNGATFPFHKLVWPGQGGYSDLAITPAGAIGIHFVYEHSTRRITLFAAVFLAGEIQTCGAVSELLPIRKGTNEKKRKRREKQPNACIRYDKGTGFMAIDPASVFA